MTANVERLHRLVTVLNGVAERDRAEPGRRHFRWTDWGGGGAGDEYDGWYDRVAELGLVTPENITDEILCGTSACVLGWAALDPGFQEEGLGFELEGMNSLRVTLVGREPRWEQEEDDNESIGRAFFGLSRGQAEFLFYGGSRPLQTAIERVRWVAERPDVDPYAPDERLAWERRAEERGVIP
jgi:hypothetical protein